MLRRLIGVNTTWINRWWAIGVELIKIITITFDVQYINDEIKNGEERDGAGHAKEVKVILFA
ncbi:MAG: hypothetical protein QMC83_05015 [Thermodesulfovibrionales bacterium]|nr:hypothetical protein [Thermodesulfovibrionales bacterium]